MLLVSELILGLPFPRRFEACNSYHSNCVPGRACTSHRRSHLVALQSIYFLCPEPAKELGAEGHVIPRGRAQPRTGTLIYAVARA